ncbi:MAG: TIGR02391 family protein [Candidatus Pacebacteria bacterium]|nr:TIGR02391 family protein [Candidatus Paceibacterota bacterium]
MNYRFVAIQVGDLLKYDVVNNEIDRAAKSVFKFKREDFPNTSITSSRAQLIHDWILSLGIQKMTDFERNKQLIEFINLITPVLHKESVLSILKSANIPMGRNDNCEKFYSRNFHEEIRKHCLKLYSQKNYFHAVFEAAKIYNKKVQEKSQNTKDGQGLMMEVWSVNGVLKLTSCITETDKNCQEGVKFLSAGLMQAMRNPTAHEPALTWPISEEDCLDMLSFISYLFKQLDKAIFYKR